MGKGAGFPGRHYPPCSLNVASPSTTTLRRRSCPVKNGPLSPGTRASMTSSRAGHTHIYALQCDTLTIQHIATDKACQRILASRDPVIFGEAPGPESTHAHGRRGFVNGQIDWKGLPRLHPSPEPSPVASPLLPPVSCAPSCPCIRKRQVLSPKPSTSRHLCLVVFATSKCLLRFHLHLPPGGCMPHRGIHYPLMLQTSLLLVDQIPVNSSHRPPVSPRTHKPQISWPMVAPLMKTDLICWLVLKEARSHQLLCSKESLFSVPFCILAHWIPGKCNHTSTCVAKEVFFVCRFVFYSCNEGALYITV